MSRTLTSLRASVTLGAFLMACGALQSVQAADTAVQRVAMACPHGSDATGCKPAPMPAQRQSASAQRAEMATAKATTRRMATARADLRDSDGSRFTYDSCGCSN
jgi:hypothetical protein